MANSSYLTVHCQLVILICLSMFVEDSVFASDDGDKPVMELCGQISCHIVPVHAWVLTCHICCPLLSTQADCSLGLSVSDVAAANKIEV